MTVIFDETRLIMRFVEFFVKGHQVVHPCHPVFHHADGCGDLCEDLPLVKQLCGPERGPDEVPEAV